MTIANELHAIAKICGFPRSKFRAQIITETRWVSNTDNAKSESYEFEDGSVIEFPHNENSWIVR